MDPIAEDMRQRAEERSILKDPQYGWDKQARKARLDRSKKVSTTLLLLSSVFCFALAVHINLEDVSYPEIYQVIMCLAIMYPLIVIGFIFEFKGLIKIYSLALPAIFLSSCALAGAALNDYNLEFNTIFWVTTVIASLILSAIAYMASRELSTTSFPTTTNFLFCAAIFLLYAAGAFIFTNCYYDNPNPAKYPTTIVDKQIDTDKTTTYHIKVGSWGESTRAWFRVSPKRYESIKPGDSVVVLSHKGLLGSPWQSLDFKDPANDGTAD